MATAFFRGYDIGLDVLGADRDGKRTVVIGASEEAKRAGSMVGTVVVAAGALAMAWFLVDRHTKQSAAEDAWHRRVKEVVGGITSQQVHTRLARMRASRARG